MNISLFTQQQSNDQYLTCIKVSDPGMNDYIVSLLINPNNPDNKMECEHPKVVAEIIALQHIALHSDIHQQITLDQLDVTVSSGQVKKALQERSTAVLNKLGAPVRLRTQNIKCKVSNQVPTWFCSKPTKEINYSRLYTNTHIAAQTFFGELKITACAIDNYIKYTGSEGGGKALKQLTRELQSTMQRQRMPDRTLQRKILKYGQRARNTRLWSNEKSNHIFVVQHENNNQTLITCYPKVGA